MTSQITNLTIVYSTVYSGTDEETIKVPRHLPLWGVTGEFPAQSANNAVTSSSYYGWLIASNITENIG